MIFCFICITYVECILHLCKKGFWIISFSKKNEFIAFREGKSKPLFTWMLIWRKFRNRDLFDTLLPCVKSEQIIAIVGALLVAIIYLHYVQFPRFISRGNILYTFFSGKRWLLIIKKVKSNHGQPIPKNSDMQHYKIACKPHFLVKNRAAASNSRIFAKKERRRFRPWMRNFSLMALLTPLLIKALQEQQPLTKY